MKRIVCNILLFVILITIIEPIHPRKVQVLPTVVLAIPLHSSRIRRQESSLPQRNDASTFVCPAVRGQFAHETECHMYYVCWDGEVVLQTCTNGYLFNTQRSMCNPARRVNCGNRRNPYECTQVQKDNCKVTGDDGPNKCQIQDDKPVCTCTGDYEADGETKCKLKEFTDCTQLQKDNCKVTGDDGPNKCEIQDDKPVCTCTGDYEADGQTKCKLKECTQVQKDNCKVTGDDGPNKCQIQDDKPVCTCTGDYDADGETKCKLKECTQVQKDNCKITGDDRPNKCQLQDDKPVCTCTGDYEADGGTKCKLKGCSEEGALLIDPTDPNKFFQCSHGVAYPKKCSSGLHFNPIIKVCEWPQSQ